MINNKYAKAYVEVLEIIKYFPQEQYSKIPKEKIEFYKENMDKEYSFKINPEIDLAEQNISIEANAIIVNLFIDYFATEQQKVKINEILKLNQKRKEQEMRKMYNPDDIFKKAHQKINGKNIDKKTDTKVSTSLVEHNNRMFARLKNFLFRILHIKK